MMLPRRGWVFFRVQFCVPASIFLALAAGLAGPVRASTAVTAEPPADLATYRNHLAQLDNVVADCQKERNATACGTSNIGADDYVRWQVRWPANGGTGRIISYDWLRALFVEAGKGPDAEKKAPLPVRLGGAPAVVKTPPPSIDKQLTAARERLAADARQIDAPVSAAPNYAAQRQALAAILARREYRGVTQTTAKDRFLEWLGNVIDALLGRLMGFGASLPWLGFAFRALFIGGLCLLLVWLLVRIERRSRVRLIEGGPTVAGAPSAREWQLWLKDAQAMAAQGLWREAIHFLYWAAISRLESRRLWPADRARTPREYLRLLPAADANRAGLTALTHTFERTWYGGRDASSAEYQSAAELAAGMGVE